MKDKIFEIVQKILPYGVLFMTFVLSMIYKFQNKMLYLPEVANLAKSPKDNPEQLRSPKGFDLVFEDVEIVTSDNIKLRGWFMPHSQRLVVI